MHRLRTAHRLARLLLAWFALALLVAVAAPLVHAESLEVVCSSAGSVKLLVHGEDGTHDASHMADCQLCASHHAGPPPVQRLAAPAPVPLAHALRPEVAAHLAWVTAAPLPARGPPLFS